MAKMWGWLIQYGSGIVLALLLGAIMGSIPLFKETSLGDTKLTASRIVQFMWYGSALLLLRGAVVHRPWFIVHRLHHAHEREE